MLAVAAAAGVAGAAGPATAATPEITAWRCLRSCYPGGKVRGGSLLLVRGRALENVAGARFRGGPGRADDRLGRVSGASRSSVRIRVPGDARTGLLYTRARGGPRSRQLRVRIVPPPVVSGWDCLRSCADGGAPRAGSLLLLHGRHLTGVRIAAFYGGPERADDRRGRISAARYHTLRARVPWEAIAGPMRVGASGGWRSGAQELRVAPLPAIGSWRCIRRCGAHDTARGGSLLLVEGVRLDQARAGYFENAAGGGADLAARVSDVGFRSVRMRIPSDALSGGFGVVAAGGARSPRRGIAVRPAAVFPVRGRHSYGERAAAFGAGRSGHRHQGQDVFARCGTWLRAARGGRVRYAGYQAAAGNYIVIDGRDPDVDYVYMHLRRRARYRTGRRVRTGALIGEVGTTGNAHGCHLHFELWSSPGWYEGGRPFDPLPYLKSWDRWS